MGQLRHDDDPTPIRDAARTWRFAVRRIDGCPGCPNIETPRTWAETPAGYLLAYLCADCGAAWTYETKEK